MTLTAQVKDELAVVSVSRASARVAEVAAIVRFAGSVETVAGHNILEIELDNSGAARRVQETLSELYHKQVQIHTIGPGGMSKSTRYVLRISDGVDEVIRRLGLITRSGHPVRGLPPQVVSGTVSDAEAAWRGAFLAAGTLTEPGRTCSLEIECPGQEAALALVGCARRLGISTKTKETRGSEKVFVRDGEAIGALLTRIGAMSTRLEWEKHRERKQQQSGGHRLANFDDANLRRSARAAVAAAARVERALEILGDDIPQHLAEAGQLRVLHRQASLEELGRLADPQMTKDAVAGRIRRLLSMADKRAEEMGLPDTNSAVTEELLEDL
ncbi:DNA-binding protein WhiA [Corynebacterium sp. H128]|uniref:DNA-binding protein WhiA n=1 Tax=unclassified Corynebacterium TaxID=2624378 RepID=UPI0030B766E4